MALQMNHTKGGIPAPESYWKLANTQLDHVLKRGWIVFNGYFNHAAREADPLGNIFDQKRYEITEDLYTTYYTEAADIRAQSYVLAKVHKDGEDPAEGQPDNRVSFFNDATDV